MKRTLTLIATAVTITAWLENPAHSLPSDAECRGVNRSLAAIWEDLAADAVQISRVDVSGLSHVAGSHVVRFKAAQADAVNALMDLADATDALGGQFRQFCGRR